MKFWSRNNNKTLHLILICMRSLLLKSMGIYVSRYARSIRNYLHIEYWSLEYLDKLEMIKILSASTCQIFIRL
jgi:hypothetical protein